MNEFKRTYLDFLKENEEALEFPIKKYMSVIKSQLEKINLNPGENKLIFDFTGEKYLAISFNIIIKWQQMNLDEYGGFITENKLISNDFKEFDITIEVKSPKPELTKILSAINHELKHVYDIYHQNTDSFKSVSAYHFLKRKWNKFSAIIHFVELSNLATKHELDARNSMIYDRLRWLKTFDKDQLMDEYKKTYVWKSLSMLSKFDYMKIISDVDHYTLIEFTNEFIESFLGSDEKLNDKNDLIFFYKNIELKFKALSNEYMNRAEVVIDELIKDEKPYMENWMFKVGDINNDMSEEYYTLVIQDFFLKKKYK